jgi:hypothetical protein
MLDARGLSTPSSAANQTLQRLWLAALPCCRVKQGIRDGPMQQLSKAAFRRQVPVCKRIYRLTFDRVSANRRLIFRLWSICVMKQVDKRQLNRRVR